MKLKQKVLIVGGMVSGLVIGGIGFGVTANAHTPTFTLTCSTYTVNLQNYNGTNHVTVRIGTDTVVDQNFGSSYFREFDSTGKEVETIVLAHDDVDGSRGWTVTDGPKKKTGCGTTTTTSTTTTKPSPTTSTTTSPATTTTTHPSSTTTSSSTTTTTRPSTTTTTGVTTSTTKPTVTTSSSTPKTTTTTAPTTSTVIVPTTSTTSVCQVVGTSSTTSGQVGALCIPVTNFSKSLPTTGRNIVALVLAGFFLILAGVSLILAFKWRDDL